MASTAPLGWRRQWKQTLWSRFIWRSRWTRVGVSHVVFYPTSLFYPTELPVAFQAPC
jgi:hypothetical protein